MPKILRRKLMDFINTDPSAAAVYEILGNDLEDFTRDQNMEVDSTKNIIGGTSINITQGNKTGTVEPYMANDDESLFTYLQGLIDTKAELDELKTDVVRVKAWETEVVGDFPATKEDVYIEIVSDGGDTTGYQIPFNIHYTGITVDGLFNPTTKVFTPA